MFKIAVMTFQQIVCAAREAAPIESIAATPRSAKVTRGYIQIRCRPVLPLGESEERNRCGRLGDSLEHLAFSASGSLNSFTMIVYSGPVDDTHTLIQFFRREAPKLRILRRLIVSTDSSIQHHRAPDEVAARDRGDASTSIGAPPLHVVFR